MSCLSLGNCGACWESPCVCGRASFSDTTLECLRTDELLALQSKITAIVTKRNQNVRYAVHTKPGLVTNFSNCVVSHITQDPFSKQGN